MPQPSLRPCPLTARDQIDILLEEYRALNALLVFRLSAMDRRLPVAGGIIAVLLGTLGALPWEMQWMLLLGLPIALVWLMRTMLGHARAKEDHLRRIDEIEHHINDLAGVELIVFQSRQGPGRPTGSVDPL